MLSPKVYCQDSSHLVRANEHPTYADHSIHHFITDDQQYFVMHGVWPTRTTDAFDVRVTYSKAGDIGSLKRYGSYAPTSGYFDPSTLQTPPLVDDLSYGQLVTGLVV